MSKDKRNREQPKMGLVEYYRSFVDEYGSEPPLEEMDRFFDGVLAYVKLDVTALGNEPIMQLNDTILLEVGGEDEADEVFARRYILSDLMRMVVHYMTNLPERSPDITITVEGKPRYTLTLGVIPQEGGSDGHV